jgi:hypothetical protein
MVLARSSATRTSSSNVFMSAATRHPARSRISSSDSRDAGAGSADGETAAGRTTTWVGAAGDAAAGGFGLALHLADAVVQDLEHRRRAGRGMPRRASRRSPSARP